MIRIHVEYLSVKFRELLLEGYVHWCHYVDEHGQALMCKILLGEGK